jgi:hypothetical protein
VLAVKTAFATASQDTGFVSKEMIMKAVQLFAMSALVLGGVALIGCDKKNDTTTTTTTTSTPAVPTTETATDKVKDAATEAGNKIESGAKKVENAADNALNNLKK